MKFYSGFSLQNEHYLFSSLINESDFTVAGFSYGAIAALQEAIAMLERNERVDRLQLLSPAFFQTKDEKFKRLQLRSYAKQKELYMKQFIESCFFPYNTKVLTYKETHIEELEELLAYVWEKEPFESLEAKGVKIEVYLGGLDAIIDVNGARKFFLELATVTYMKNANHFLQTS